MNHTDLQLNAEERIVLLRVLGMMPPARTRKTVDELENLRSRLELSDKDKKTIEYKSVEGPAPSVTCDRPKARKLVKKVSLTPWNHERIAVFLRFSELNSDLQSEYVSLYDLFCGNH